MFNILFLIFSLVSGRLLGVIEFNRHGARTPRYFENLSKELFYKSSSSHLTLNGFTQASMLVNGLRIDILINIRC